MRIKIVETKGSTPRPRGTYMLVTERSCAGTIGGGHLELEAIALAKGQSAANPLPKTPFTKHFSLGPSLGQCCGGAVDLLFEVVDQRLLLDWPEDETRFTLALFGAGHVGRAIVDALTLLPCHIIWVDERTQEFPIQRQASNRLDIRCVDAPSAEISTLAPGTFVIITTHSHDLDLALCEAALLRSDLGFIGLIGSGTKKAKFLRRLEQRNVPDTLRLVCPIGLPSIGGKAPQVIAASVAAQLLELS
jgi:xanthine dehydrogenase accessory factor